MSTFSQSPNNDKNNLKARLQIDYLLDNKTIEKEDIQEVTSGLRRVPKTLPARYFYDSKGSQLFEQICQLPEYYPTRTEASILEQCAVEIVNQTKADELIELGSGSSSKTRILLDAFQRLNRTLYYTPVDVSGSILKASAYNLLADYANLKIRGKVATYGQALQELQNSFLGTRMIVFLGSSIGNFNDSECDRLIEQVTAALNPGDYFLLGIDLQKPLEILNAAYNDAQGVTAAFNLNMLQHLNHRFQGNFDLSLFKHQATYNQIENQIEMYLISQQAQSVTLENLHLTIELEEGEAILTEISRKFNLEQMQSYLGDRHLKPIQSYTDSQQWFGLLLCQKSN